MVRGLNIFRDHFKNHTDHYTLIGGVACDLLFDEAGIPFRATQDLDIVITLEVIGDDFVNVFNNFIKNGDCKSKQRSDGSNQYYRFTNPSNEIFPKILELFSINKLFNLSDSAIITPIPTSDDMSSLSAILLNDEYYSFLNSGRRVINNIPILDPEYLIALKAKAWLDLYERKLEGDNSIDSRDISKHKNDVFRLFQIIDPEKSFEIPNEVKNDMNNFIIKMDNIETNLKALGLRSISKNDILNVLRSIYS